MGIIIRQVFNEVSFVGAPPTVGSITPNTGVTTKTISITNLTGTGFLSGATVKLNRTGSTDIASTNVTIVSPTKITCTFDLIGKTAGQWNVAVTIIDGKSAVLANGFTITALAAPVAGFSTTPTNGTLPLTVAFSDTSTGTITSYLWDFGDGNSSNFQNPAHIYTKASSYTVKLTVRNTAGSNTVTKKNYIQ